MKPRGFTVLEIAVASVMVGVLAAVCLQFFHAAAGQRRALNQRLTATQEAANAMERLADRPWDELTTQAARNEKLSPQAVQALPDGEVEVRIDEAAGSPPAKRIAVLIRWRPLKEAPAQSVRLTAWRYKTP